MKTSRKATKKFTRKSTKINTLKHNKTYYLISCPNKKDNDFNIDYLASTLKKYHYHTSPLTSQITQLDTIYFKKHKINASNCNNINNLPSLNTLTKSINNNHIDFIWFSPNYNRLNIRFYHVKATLSNMLNSLKINKLYDKSKLPHLTPKLLPFLPKTFQIDDYKNYDFAKVNPLYILKPSDSFAGKDILYISSKYELTKAIEFYNGHRNYKNKIYGKDVIAQEYIANPLLFYKLQGLQQIAGYKCHFRVMFLVSYIKNRPAYSVFPIIRIITAKQPFNLTIPFSTDVHDSHIKSTGDDLFLHTDYAHLHIKESQIELILEQINVICEILFNYLKNDKTSIEWLHPEHKNAFTILGLDFMITEQLNVKLIECNNQPSFKYFHQKNIDNVSKEYFDWIGKNVFSKM